MAKLCLKMGHHLKEATKPKNNRRQTFYPNVDIIRFLYYWFIDDCKQQIKIL